MPEAVANTAKTTEAAAPAVKSSEQSIVDVLHYDPFKKGDEIPEGTSKAAPETKPAAGASAPEKPATANTGTGNETQGNPPAPNGVPKKDADADQAAHWQQLAEHYRGLVEKGDKGGKPEGEEDPTKVPAYNITVPDELITALTAEDVPTFKKGVTALIQGMATMVHQQMLGHMQKLYDPRFSQIPQTIQGILQAQKVAHEVESDFYGTYKELNHPAIRPIVQETAKAYAKEKGYTSWNQDIRDETAKRVKTLLAGITGQAQPAPKAPAMLPSGGGARPPVKTATESDDIFNTLFQGN